MSRKPLLCQGELQSFLPRVVIQKRGLVQSLSDAVKGGAHRIAEPWDRKELEKSAILSVLLHFHLSALHLSRDRKLPSPELAL